jgi:hypothetical protein
MNCSYLDARVSTNFLREPCDFVRCSIRNSGLSGLPECLRYDRHCSLGSTPYILGPWHHVVSGISGNTHTTQLPSSSTEYVRSPPPLLVHSCLSSSRGPRTGVCILTLVLHSVHTLSTLSNVCQRDRGSLREPFCYKCSRLVPARLLIGSLRVTLSLLANEMMGNGS